jgi:zinc/manganese transport system permease protein
MFRISENYQQALGEGMTVVWWDFLFYSLLGLVICLAVRLAGVVLVFMYLIIPATISTLFSSRQSTQLIIIWIFSIAGSMGGLLVAYYLDFSVGPAIGMVLGLILVVSALSRKLQRC